MLRYDHTTRTTVSTATVHCLYTNITVAVLLYYYCYVDCVPPVRYKICPTSQVQYVQLTATAVCTVINSMNIIVVDSTRYRVVGNTECLIMHPSIISTSLIFSPPAEHRDFRVLLQYVLLFVSPGLWTLLAFCGAHNNNITTAVLLASTLYWPHNCPKEKSTHRTDLCPSRAVGSYEVIALRALYLVTSSRIRSFVPAGTTYFIDKNIRTVQ